jgi:hypothetical protein
LHHSPISTHHKPKKFLLSVGYCQHLLELQSYPNRKDLKREYPELEEADIREALAYAAAM